ncbi:hypothetical protein E4Q23_22710 [Candidatus Accumulibacter phosphatis]|uniref:Uncharacterized protein n=1 Tax=Candidatus Accumulibacter phosphatis TaxID=327160 RepID=A0ABX1U3M7_9PROT|nr:hypothetical protein [Candidatus Accumulibacter phosphatis]NMQ30320.1 hypothetical protein [Candidatus Accumulibacter phosphatis]
MRLTIATIQAPRTINVRNLLLAATGDSAEAAYLDDEPAFSFAFLNQPNIRFPAVFLVAALCLVPVLLPAGSNVFFTQHFFLLEEEHRESARGIDAKRLTLGGLALQSP